MSTVQMLRALVKQRLTAAAEDIFGLFERTIAEYEETLCRSKEENERQRRLLDAVFNPQLRLHRAAADDESTAASGPGVTSQETTADNVADVEQLLVNKEEVPAEHQQEWSPSLDQEDPEPPHIKEEQEEVWTNPEQEQLQGLEEVKEKEDEEKPQSSQLHQRQTEQMKTEADGDDCGGPEPDRNSHPDTEDKTEETEVSDDFQQLSLTKEEVPPEQQQEEWSSSLDQEDLPELRHIKEEQEEVLTSQEEEQLQELEEADLTKFTFTPVPVKSEEDAEEKSQSSQLHKRQTEQMKTEVDGEDCQGPQPEPHPDTHLQPVSEDSDDNDDWKESQEPQSGLNFPKNKGYNSFGKGFRCSLCGKQFCSRSNLNIHMRIHTGEKPFSCLVCGKGFIQMTHLQSHLKFHTREKPYSCTLCNIFFSQSDILLSHLKTHTREKPFSCNVCHKSFTRRHLVKRHKCGGESRRQTEQMETEADGEDCREPGPVRNLHPNTHLTPDTNDKIEESSESETDVSDGDWRETREPQSGLNFKKNTEVPVSRMTFTTAEKQFLLHTCSECGKMFGNKPNLNVHMRIHTVEKPFICLVCGKIFERGEDLRQHMVVHPGKKK